MLTGGLEVSFSICINKFQVRLRFTEHWVQGSIPYFRAARATLTVINKPTKSVNLTTLFPTQAWLIHQPVLCEDTFACNWHKHFLNQTFEENDSRNYFMVNLHESMGLGRYRTHDPWICNQLATDCMEMHEGHEDFVWNKSASGQSWQAILVNLQSYSRSPAGIHCSSLGPIHTRRHPKDWDDPETGGSMGPEWLLTLLQCLRHAGKTRLAHPRTAACWLTTGPVL